MLETQVSTSLDQMFMALFIGGALANAKSITLGQLFIHDDKGEMLLQYVHDFGDWWTHTITVSEYQADGNDCVPKEARVAYLVSGENGNLIDDTGGVSKYCEKMCQLMLPREVDPSNEEWWTVFNEQIRQKSNIPGLLSNPLHFNLDATRAAIEKAVRRPLSKSGRENMHSTTVHYQTGLTYEFNTSTTASPPKNRKKLCSVCGVTVALKLCTACQEVAYCSREHQLQHWKSHKVECKKFRAEKGSK